MSSNNRYVLIDSSVWIDYFRHKKSKIADPVNALLDEDRVAICGMVELEILQGLRGKESSLVQDLFHILYFVEARREDFVSAGMMLNQLRTKGITMSSSDCLIAAQCLRFNCHLFTLDEDFRHIHGLQKYK